MNQALKYYGRLLEFQITEEYSKLEKSVNMIRRHYQNCNHSSVYEEK